MLGSGSGAAAWQLRFQNPYPIFCSRKYGLPVFAQKQGIRKLLDLVKVLCGIFWIYP